MALIHQVAEILRGSEIPFAVIGAAAMASHGFTRATHDVDVLTTDKRVLQVEVWVRAREAGIDVAIHRGDFDDPLGGVVRLRRQPDEQVDVVLGKLNWQKAVIERAEGAVLFGARLPRVVLSDLILMKLFGGGPRDAWDIHFVLDGAQSPEILQEVEREIENLPADAKLMWEKILEQRKQR